MLTVNCLIHISCFLQEGCCGAHNHTDYAHFDDWKVRYAAYPNAKAPLSCCKKSSSATGDTPTSLSDFDNFEQCLAGDQTYINSKVSEITALTELVTAYIYIHSEPEKKRGSLFLSITLAIRNRFL